MKIGDASTASGISERMIRHYEKIGLIPAAARTDSGYRDYEDDAAARLLFIARARRMGLSCDQVTSLLPVWSTSTCGATQERVLRLVEDKQAEIADRIAELQQFAAQLDDVRARLQAEAPPPGLSCRPQLLRA